MAQKLPPEKREKIAKATLVQLRLAAMERTSEEKQAYQVAIADYEKIVSEQARKKDELKIIAEQDQIDYDAANYKDDQFDLSDALIAAAISLLAVTAFLILTRLALVERELHMLP